MTAVATPDDPRKDPNGISNILGRNPSLFDPQGRFDPNGDGVGGLMGLLKAIVGDFGNENTQTMGTNIFERLFERITGQKLDPEMTSRRDPENGKPTGPEVANGPQWQPDIAGNPMVGKPYNPLIQSLNGGPGGPV